MAMTTDEFLRRLLLHVLPRGSVRIRHFGFLCAPRPRASIVVSRRLLAQAIPRLLLLRKQQLRRPRVTVPVLWRRHDHPRKTHCAADPLAICPIELLNRS